MEVHQESPHVGLYREQTHQGPRHDAQSPFGPDDDPLHVEAWSVRRLPTECHDLPAGKDDLEPEDMAGRAPFGQTMGAAGVVGDVASDSASRLGGRIGSEVEPVGSCGLGQVEIDDPCTDPGRPIVRVDVDRVHGRRGEDDPAAGRTGAGGQTGPCAPSHDRHPVPLRDADDLRHLGGIGREHNGRGLPPHQ